MEMMNPGDAFLKDYKDRHSTYFSDRPEDRSIDISLGDALVGASVRATNDARETAEREGMNTSATQNLNPTSESSLRELQAVPGEQPVRGSGEQPVRGPGGLTREEFEALSDDEQFRTVLKDSMPTPHGLHRVVTGVADFLTGNQYDYDRRG